MKKLLLLGIFALAFPRCGTKTYAMNNVNDFQRWRSTDISAAQDRAFLSSGCPCVVWDITVTSGAQNPGQSGFQFMWSTNTVNLGSSFQQYTATSPYFDTSKTGDIFPLGEVVVSSSIFYRKDSSFGTLRMRWDYYYGPPKTMEKKGLKPQQ